MKFNSAGRLPNQKKFLDNSRLMIITVTLVSALLFSSCSAAAPVPTQTPTLAPPTATALPTETQTPIPTSTSTETAVPTATYTPSVTPVPPLAIVPEKTVSWCIPLNADGIADVSAGEVPQGAISGTLKDGKLSQQVQANACRFSFLFNQPVPAGVELQIFDANAKTPWLKVPLIQDGKNPLMASGTVRHTYVINPPFWKVSYPMAVIGPNGNSLFKATLDLFKPEPNRCWDGSLPNITTLLCPNWDGDWNYKDFPNFNPNADIFNSLGKPNTPVK
jgi:hypothetical protein